LVKQVIIWILTFNTCKIGWKKGREPVCLRHADLFLWLIKIQPEPVLLEKQHWLEERGTQLRGNKKMEKEKKARQIILKIFDEILSNLAYFIPYQI